MEIGDTLYVVHRKPWREWLEANFEAATEIWLIYPNKASGEPRILYNDTVEEALCFGWIDSTIKKLDSMHAVQRSNPRNPKSGYSQQNKERLRWLAGKGLLHPSVRESVSDILDEEFVFPKTFLRPSRRTNRRGPTSRVSHPLTGGSGWHTSTPPRSARTCTKAG